MFYKILKYFMLTADHGLQNIEIFDVNCRSCFTKYWNIWWKLQIMVYKILKYLMYTADHGLQNIEIFDVNCRSCFTKHWNIFM